MDLRLPPITGLADGSLYNKGWFSLHSEGLVSSIRLEVSEVAYVLVHRTVRTYSGVAVIV